MNDPYDNGTPKYSTAQAIYDALEALTDGEERGILSQMFEDVSWDGQEYYYMDAGDKLKERFEALSDDGDKLWLLDLAIVQLDQQEIHDSVYEALMEPELAKRLGFKKLFVESMLRGDATQYAEVTEEFADALGACNRFGSWEMVTALHTVMEPRGYWADCSRNAYDDLCNALSSKVQNLKLQAETQLIVECRALLSSYDDFMFGLRANQALFKEQERAYNAKLAQLESRYQQKVEQLLAYAEKNGFAKELSGALRMLDAGRKEG